VTRQETAEDKAAREKVHMIDGLKLKVRRVEGGAWVADLGRTSKRGWQGRARCDAPTARLSLPTPGRNPPTAAEQTPTPSFKTKHPHPTPQVDKLLSRRKLKKDYEYEVQWQGQGPDTATWLPRDDLVEMGFERLVNELDAKEAARQGLMLRPLTKANVEKHLAVLGLEPEFATHAHMRGLSGGQKVRGGGGRRGGGCGRKGRESCSWRRVRVCRVRSPPPPPPPHAQRHGNGLGPASAALALQCGTPQHPPNPATPTPSPPPR
jgi:hypothetical protein